MEREKIPWSLLPFVVLTAKAKILCETVALPMGSKNIDVGHVSGKAVKIRHQMFIQKNVEKKYCEHIKSEAVYEVLKGHLEYHVPQSLDG